MLGQVGDVLGKLIEEFGKHDNAACAKTLSPASKLSLYAAQAAISMAV